MLHDTPTISHWEVRVPAGTVALEGTLSLPSRPSSGLVVFAHGSGSNRQSPRNRFVASYLNERGHSTLLVDLFVAAREADGPFDLASLSERLSATVDWACAQQGIGAGKIGLFGASTGAAVALVAAASRPSQVHAVVSRGGRPDLAATELPRVDAPTLLIVGSEDHAVLGLNVSATRALRTCELAQVTGAGHLFEEPGALRRVAELTELWFSREFRGRPLASAVQ
jgi:putative phosphoribosyl transferase